MTQVIADHNINLNGITIRNDTDALFMVDDVEATSAALKEAGFAPTIEDVIAVEIPNVPGGLNTLLKVFSDAGVNIEQLYLFELNSKVYFIFNIKDLANAISVLKEAGAEIVQ